MPDDEPQQVCTWCGHQLELLGACGVGSFRFAILKHHSIRVPVDGGLFDPPLRNVQLQRGDLTQPGQRRGGVKHRVELRPPALCGIVDRLADGIGAQGRRGNGRDASIAAGDLETDSDGLARLLARPVTTLADAIRAACP